MVVRQFLGFNVRSAAQGNLRRGRRCQRRGVRRYRNRRRRRRGAGGGEGGGGGRGGGE